MYTHEEAEGQRLKNPFDTITEGIGINRLTKNFMMVKLDGAFRGTDMEAVQMSRFGSSSFLFSFLFSLFLFGLWLNQVFPDQSINLVQRFMMSHAVCYN